MSQRSTCWRSCPQSHLHDHICPASVRPQLPLPAADAVAAQFAIQYAFGLEETASRVLGVASALLRDGGVLFGVAPDATAILRLIESNSAAPAAAMETHLQPPAYPFSLLLRLLANGSRDEFGAPLLFSLEDELQERGAIYKSKANWEPNVVVDGALMTGQSPASADPLAEALSEVLLK